MITLFTGSPGAGKTASLVDFLSKLPGDRPIYSDGLEGLVLPHTPCDASKWPQEVPDGAILVIDEVQRIWRPRGSAAKVPESVSELETHRHRGIDIYVTTQAPSLLDSNVRRLVGRHVHIRDTGVMGRYWYEWPECNDSMNWKSCINKKRFSLPKKAFELYKSSSLHTTPVRTIPPALYVIAVAFLALIVLLYMSYGVVKKNETPKPDPAAAVVQADPNSSAVVLQNSQGNRVIDDRIDWIPRVSNKPESAPAFDHLRVVVAMPVVAIAMCLGDECICKTQQGTNAGLTSRECRQWLENPPFDPYRQKERQQDNALGHQPGNVQPSALTAVLKAPPV